MEAAQEALVAWRREGLRLVSLLSAPEDVRDLITEASERVLSRLDQLKRSRAPLVLTEAGEPDEQKRRRAPLSRTARHTCFTVCLTEDFLHPADIVAIMSVSRSMQKLASADTVWDWPTRCSFPEAGQLRKAGARAPTRHREYLRMVRLWPWFGRATAPRLEAYSAVVVIMKKREGFHGKSIFSRACEMKTVDADAETSDCFVIDVDIPVPTLRHHNFKLDGSKFPGLTVSVFLVRKVDGKCMRLVANAEGVNRPDLALELGAEVALDADPKYVPLGEKNVSPLLRGLVTDDDGFLTGIRGPLEIYYEAGEGHIYSCASQLFGWDRSANWL